MPILDAHQPFHHDGDRVGVLFCHGFTSNPSSLIEWARHVAEAGHTVALPRLPGHGTIWQELAVTRWQDWYECVDAEYGRLAERCDACTGVVERQALAIEQPVHLLDRRDAHTREAAPAQALAVGAVRLGRVPLHRHVRRHVLQHDRGGAEHRVDADAAELVDDGVAGVVDPDEETLH